MPQYVAFLRAINVGGHTVKMDHLRRLFAAMGFANVETFIASGNVIFEATAASPRDLEQKIGASLQESLGYSVATFIRTTAELAAIASYQPFPAAELNAEGHTLYVAFLTDPPREEARQKLLAFTSADDEFHVAGREVYWLCRTRMSESAFSGALLEKTLNMPATLRNATTIKKIAAKYS
ncbi:MAG: DUF1697 domain-containing protein [Chloroflexota bacterium]